MRNYQGRGLCYLSKPKAEADNTNRGLNNSSFYIASAETKRDWLIHDHVALDKCNVSLGQ